MSGPTMLRCVTCGSESLDRWDLAAGDFAAGDHEAVTTFPDTDDYAPERLNPLRTRGGFTEVGLICGAGHVQRLVFGNHKGNEYVGVFAGEAGR